MAETPERSANMEIINTNPKGNRILHVIPDENDHPQFGAWYFNAENADLLFVLLEAEHIDFQNMDIGDRHYLVGRRRGEPDTGAIVIKYTREGEEGDKDYIIHDIVFGENFAVACDVIERYYNSSDRP